MGAELHRLEFASGMRSVCGGMCMVPGYQPADALAFLLDANLGVILVLWLLATASVGAGYVLGRDAWAARFSVELDFGLGKMRVSGFWTEWALITYVALLVVLVEKLTPDTNIVRLAAKSWPFLPIMFAVTAILVAFHEVREVRAARLTHAPDHVRELAKGYAPYTVFSTIIFCMFFIAASLIIDQFNADKKDFLDRRAELEAAYAVLLSPSGEQPAGSTMIALERINGLLSAAIYAVTEQINTVLIVLYCVLAINLFIEFTPMRTAYSPAAVVWTHFVVGAALFIVISVAAYLYSTEYLGMLHRVIVELASLENRIAHEGWESARRYYELLTEFRGKQGFTGFVLTMTTGRGGVAFFATALQAVFSYLKRDKPRQFV